MKQFWKTVKPLFSDQTKFSEKIEPMEGDKIFHKMLNMQNFWTSFFIQT